MTTTYYILDHEVILLSPEPVLRAFDRIYGRFKDPGACGLPGTVERTHARIAIEQTGDVWTVSTPWDTLRCAEEEGLTHLLFFMQNHVVKGARSVLAVHGASLVVEGRGCILAAPSATGKTTLTVELVRRGARFLSDEIAALSTAEAVQHAFPRAIGLREDSLRVLELDPDVIHAALRVQGEITIVVDPGQIAGNRIDVSTAPEVVLFLAPPGEASADVDPGLDYLELGFSALPECAQARLSAIPRVRSVSVLAGRPYPTLRVAYTKGERIIEETERALAGSGAVICGHHRGASLPIDYAAAPTLSPLSAGAGIMRLLPSAMNMHALAGIVPPEKILFHLSRLLGHVQFFELTPGRLKDTADLVERVCREATVTHRQ